jgi:ABC-type branched-subunit amino acid transport system ATPase component
MTATLAVHGVEVRYGGVTALAGVDLRIEPGEIVGLIGPNGSGKTTLLDVVSGQIRPRSGTVLLDGLDLVDHLPEDRAAAGVVRSFQDCRLYPELTVEETLLVAEDARRPVGVLASALRLPRFRHAEAAKRAAVDDAMGWLGLDRFRGNLISELSTGTRRIVDLATMVAARPRLLLLDEPTAGIAQREAEAFGPLLRRLHEITGSTICIVEHDVPLASSLCDRLVVMEAGRVIASGPPAAVMSDPAAVAAYLGASEQALARSGLARPSGRRRSQSGRQRAATRSDPTTAVRPLRARPAKHAEKE